MAAASEDILNPNFLSNADIRCTLGRTPSVPDQVLHGLLSSTCPSTKWRIAGSKNCEVSGQNETRSIYLRMETSSRIKINLRRGNPSVQNDNVLPHDGQSHYTAVLALAWAYILSARLVELQGTKKSLWQYTDHHAPINAHQSERVSDFEIDVGDVDRRATRWFAAILAPQYGFRASVDFTDDYPSWIPWSYSLTAENNYSISSKKSDSALRTISEEMPLSSYEALQNMVQFCDYHGLGTFQLHLALATALLFPTHSSLGHEVSLLSPTLLHQPAKPHTGIISQQDLVNLYEDLPAYIMLSCTGEVVNSLLCGVFWNPHSKGNLCSPWLQPLVDLKDSEHYKHDPGRFHCILAAICARRAPNIAYLSYAAAVSGLMSRILQQVISGQPPLDPLACAWTGIPQSFMDLAGEGPYFQGHDDKEYILRSDCWRLRRLPPVVDDDLHYMRDPFSPWVPPGFGLLSNCPLRVQVHKHCARHSRIYMSIRWTFEDGHMLEDDMVRDERKPHSCPDKDWGVLQAYEPLKYTGDQGTSINATRTTFNWVLVNGEGKPSEKPYDSPWLFGVGHDSEESENTISDDCDSRSGVLQGDWTSADSSSDMHAWIAGIASEEPEKQDATKAERFATSQAS